MSINQRLKQIRKQLSKTQEQFSVFFDMTRENYGKIENGGRNIPNEMLIICHERFNINLNWLITGSGKMKLTGENIEVCEPKIEYGSNPWQKLAEERESRIADLKTIDELKKEINRLKVFERMVAEQPHETVKKS